MATKNILSIGIEIPEIEYNYFSSNKSLLGADIIIISPDTSSYSFNNRSGFIKDTSRLKRELSILLEEGKTVFVILREPKRPIPGLSSDNYCFLPISLGEMFEANGTGEEIKKCKNINFEDFNESFIPLFTYQTYIKSETAEPIYKTKSGDYILGGIYSVGRGHIVALPYFDFSDDSFISYNEEEHEDEWNKKAISFGKRLTQCLIKIDNSFKSNQPSSLPIWVEEPAYELTGENEAKNKIRDNKNKILELKSKNSEFKRQLKDIQKMKRLLYETGKPLENAVTDSLKLLGFKAEGFDDGELELDQVIIDPNGNRLIGECEGKDNCAIDIDKFRQLVDSLNEDWSKNGSIDRATGLLFGNPERLKKTEERTVDFTDKCKRGAEREKVGLILTKDLFKIVQYLKNKNDEKFKEDCRKAIFDNLGKIIEFPEIPKEK